MEHLKNHFPCLAIFITLGYFLFTQPAGATSNLPSSQIGPTDPAEIETFMDDFWRQDMQPLQIPGAVFVLVKDSRVLFAKGYGLADIDQGKPVDPGTTLFSVGSVSKAVTAGAVLQLVERNQLRLDEPVNNYLRSFQIEKTCTTPVTTAHLLTHSAGFDERAIGAFALSTDQMIPLAEYVARDLPPCIRPPAQEMSYCNHCYGLAGLMVQEISGVPFEQYVEDNLFQPLQMQHSSFRQPLPTELDSLRARGYIFSPAIQPAPQMYWNFFPSGGLWTSGEDMGRLIIAYLEGGLPGGKEVYNQETLALLQQRQFSQDPRLEGWTYGFFEHMENGQRMIGKDGDSPGFSSALYLLPEHNLGFFLSYNATLPAQPGVVDPRLNFPSYFLDHYYPASETLLPAKPSGAASRLAGFYRWSRFSHTSIDKAISPMSILQWQIRTNPDGSLVLAYPSLLGGQTSTWVEVEAGLFQNQGNGSFLAYEQDNHGYITHIFTKITEEGVLERVAWYETLTFQGFILVFMVGVFVSMLVIQLLWVVRRTITAQNRQQLVPVLPGHGSGVFRLTPWISGSLAGLNLLFLVGLALTVAQSLTIRAPQVPGYMLGLLVIPLVTAFLTLLMLVFTLLAWRDRSLPLPRKAIFTLVTLAGMSFTWFTWYWNLFGFRL